MKKVIIIVLSAISFNTFANDALSGIVSGMGTDVKKHPIPEKMLDSNDEDKTLIDGGFIIKKDVFIVCTEKGGTVYVRNGSEYDDGSTDIQAIAKVTPEQCGFDI